jgi:alkyl hydroperoxide reductase subunit AhpC
MVSEFDMRDVKLIVLAPNTIEAHRAWVNEIQGITPDDIVIPFIADPEKKIAYRYDMVDQNIVNTGEVPQSIRDIFIIDNNKRIRLIFSYPPTVGSNTEEILRVIDALKTSDKLGILTGVNWYPGANVIVDPAKQSIEEAQQTFNGEVEGVADFVIAPVSVEESAAPNPT